MSRILRFDIRSHRGEPSLLYPLKPNPAALLMASAGGEKGCNRDDEDNTTAPYPFNTLLCEATTQTDGDLASCVSVIGKNGGLMFPTQH